MVLMILTVVGCGDKAPSSEPSSNNQTLMQSSQEIEPGVYTELQWSNGSYNVPPDECHGYALMSGDFAIYSQTSGTYFNSITEDMVVDGSAQSVAFSSGLKFFYKYIELDDEWQITYGPGCARRYRKT